MKMARVIRFTGRMDAMSKYYREVLGLKQVTNEKGRQEFAAGGARIALHSGPSSPGRKGPKIVFHAKDVAASLQGVLGPWGVVPVAAAALSHIGVGIQSNIECTESVYGH